MSLVSAIYDAPVVHKETNEKGGYMARTIKYDGKLFLGEAFCHTLDKDFFSPKVGYTIAISRARIKALKYAKTKAKEEVNWKYKIYTEITNRHSFDANGNLRFPELWHNYERASWRFNSIEEALKTEQQALQNYLDAQARAITVIKDFREKDKNVQPNT